VASTVPFGPDQATASRTAPRRDARPATLPTGEKRSAFSSLPLGDRVIDDRRGAWLRKAALAALPQALSPAPSPSCHGKLAGRSLAKKMQPLARRPGGPVERDPTARRAPG